MPVSIAHLEEILYWFADEVLLFRLLCLLGLLVQGVVTVLHALDICKDFTPVMSPPSKSH